MAFDDAVVMAPSLKVAAVKLEAELVRKSIRRDNRFRTLPKNEKAAEKNGRKGQPKPTGEGKQGSADKNDPHPPPKAIGSTDESPS